jgi:hypothetical protein
MIQWWVADLNRWQLVCHEYDTRTNPTAEASAKDVVPITKKAYGSSSGPGKDVAKVDTIGSSRWKTQLDTLFQFDDMQEQASSGIMSAMTKFVERTTVMKKVHTPCSPRAPWRILDEICCGALRVTT